MIARETRQRRGGMPDMGGNDVNLPARIYLTRKTKVPLWRGLFLFVLKI